MYVLNSNQQYTYIAKKRKKNAAKSSLGQPYVNQAIIYSITNKLVHLGSLLVWHLNALCHNMAQWIHMYNEYTSSM